MDPAVSPGYSGRARPGRILDVRTTRSVVSVLSRIDFNFVLLELLKINHYKAPRDKLICILNACKVIFGEPHLADRQQALIPVSGLIRHLKKEEGADTFVPILIYVVLKASPENLLSNVEYVPALSSIGFLWLNSRFRFISRFRNPEKLQSEAGYYLSSLVSTLTPNRAMYHVLTELLSRLKDGRCAVHREHGPHDPHHLRR